VKSLPSVSLYIRITDEKGRRRYERIRRRSPQMCGEKDVFCLHFYDKGKRKWLSVGTDLNAANAARGQKEQELLLLSKDEATQAKPSPAVPKTLEQLRTAFVHDKRTTIKKDGTPLEPDTIRSFEVVTRGFLDTIKRTSPSEVTKQDLKDWMMKLRQGDPSTGRKPVCHRTVCNLYDSVAAFLMFAGVDHKKLLPQCERPTPVEQTPEAYTVQEWNKFMFVITDARDALAFEFLQKTGPREREMTYLEWTDLNLGPNPTVKFQTKEGFRTKTGKSRVVPLERSLANKLTEWQAKNQSSRLVFPTAKEEVEGHFLRKMKEYAKKAGLNPTDFWLHKCRDTFATWALRRGVDIRTVQHWLGHADITMTQRYLAPEQGEHAQSQINRAFGDTLATSAMA
jgi:integrase/recombinase XerD